METTLEKRIDRSPDSRTTGPKKGDDARTVFWTGSDVISLTKDAREKLGYETRLGR